MDFELSEEQRLLQESVGRLLTDRYGFEQRTAYMKEPGGFSRALWKQYADLGLLALPFAEEDGGIGGGSVDIMIVMEAMGRALVLEPYLATVVLAGGVLRHAGNKKQRADLIPKIAMEALFSRSHLGTAVALRSRRSQPRQAGRLFDGQGHRLARR
jgi:alkylation response protein AidB-like acyl-CoA dehydrogenase